MTLYYKQHFYYGSTINNVSVSGKTIDEAKKAIALDLKSYTLTLKERDGKVERINADQIGLKYNSENEISNLKDKQNPFKWVLAFADAKDTKMAQGVSYDDNLIKKQIDSLASMNSGNIVEPKSASFKYNGSSYDIVNEVRGNKVDKDALYKKIVDAVKNGETTLDLEAAKCYEEPKYTAKSAKVAETKKTLDKYVDLKITYDIGQSKEVVDGSKINKWINVDDEENVKLDENKVKNYFYALSGTYDTVGKTRTFTTSGGNNVQVSGGDYGWNLNSAQEAKNLIQDIKNGKNIEKQPAFLQKALGSGSNDIGKTYVEVNLTKQHVWFYKNGSLVTQGDVVTGNVAEGNATPAGVYYIKYKARNFTLKGQGYASPVDYWMPFNNGIGLHDASWRASAEFGGTTYQTRGSHGCVNCPHDLAQTIYQNIDTGTPVVCYTE